MKNKYNVMVYYVGNDCEVYQGAITSNISKTKARLLVLKNNIFYKRNGIDSKAFMRKA